MMCFQTHLIAARSWIFSTSAVPAILLVILLMTTLSGCLQTRSDLAEEDEQKKIQTTVTGLQRSHADQDAHFDNIDGSLRDLTGRIETDEHKNAGVQDGLKTQIAAQQKKIDEILAQMKIFDDTILKAHQRIDVLEKQMAAYQEAAAAAPAVSAAGDGKGKADHFQDGEQHFTAKEWKKAIAAYQKYRETNPKGKELSMATLRIGMAFQELGMKSEAKSFYQEVLEKYPKDKGAKTAASRLKQLKK